MNQIDVKDLSRNPSNARAEVAEPTPEIQFRASAQGFEITNGHMRAAALADLGRVVPALNVVTGDRVLLKRDHSGQWLIATQEDAEFARLQSQMRVGRKWNSGVNPQPKPTPFYRQFDKRKF